MRIVLEGAIAGFAFASGDNFVVGMWDSGPLGAMTDVMWRRPDGTRRLLAPDEDVARFVGGTYSFDETEVRALDCRRVAGSLSLTAGDLRVEAVLGRPHRLFSVRPRPLRRSLAWVRFEDAVLRRIVGRFVIGGAEGVRMYGTTPGGSREWYRIDSYRPVVAARASLDGADLGPLVDLDPDPGFGFSGFPRRPAYVRCSPVLEGPEVSRLLPSACAGTLDAMTDAVDAVRIEPWGPDDLPLLRQTMGDPAMTEHLGGPESPEKLAERQTKYERLAGSGQGRMFKIVHEASGEAVGTVGYWDRSWRDEDVYETGWSVVPAYQGRGIAADATAQAMRAAARDGAHRFVFAYPSVDNAGSNAICRKLGFELVEVCGFEYPPGNRLTCNVWRLDLEAFA